VANKAFNEVDSEVGRALALEPFANKSPFTLYTLKQFRDVQNPEKACYQSLLRIPRVLNSVEKEQDHSVTVRIFDYPDFHIVKDLGILAHPLREKTAGIGYIARGEEPFMLHAEVEEQLAERLLRRAGSKQWTIYDQAFEGMMSPAKGAYKVDARIPPEKAREVVNKVDANTIIRHLFETMKKNGPRRRPRG
jgi:hypothetical protein